MSLFEPPGPLAWRIRPRRIEEYAGQPHLMAPGAPLRRLLERDALPSLILFGPPGTGKTSLARLVAGATRSHFERVSAVESGVGEVRKVLADAKARRQGGERTLLFLDEIHRFSKSQQDALLPGVESGLITLVGATTVNPGFGVIGPLLSRCQLFRLQPLADDALGALLDRAFTHPDGLPGRALAPGARETLIRIAAGDGRRLLGLLEVAAGLAANPEIDAVSVNEAAERAAASYDRNADAHYDFASAFIKSIRGSDPDAVIYYLVRMLEGGEEPRFIARRLMISAAEDVGLADPQALPVAVAAAQAYEMLGSPEGKFRSRRPRSTSRSPPSRTAPTSRWAPPARRSRAARSTRRRRTCATPAAGPGSGWGTARATAIPTTIPAAGWSRITCRSGCGTGSSSPAANTAGNPNCSPNSAAGPGARRRVERQGSA